MQAASGDDKRCYGLDKSAPVVIGMSFPLLRQESMPDCDGNVLDCEGVCGGTAKCVPDVVLTLGESNGDISHMCKNIYIYIHTYHPGL